MPCSPACGPLVALGQPLLQLYPLSLGLGWLTPLPPSSLTQTSVSPTPYLKVGPHPTLCLCLFLQGICHYVPRDGFSLTVYYCPPAPGV